MMMSNIRPMNSMMLRCKQLRSVSLPLTAGARGFIRHIIVFIGCMILLIGFPKSGTKSFHRLFQDLGYVSYHWKKGKEGAYIGMLVKRNKEANRPLLNDFQEHDAITQMDVCMNEATAYWPQLTDYERLYHENSDSIFILNKRDPSDLLSSFKRWDKYHKRLYKYSSELISDKTDEGFMNFVSAHYARVEAFFSRHPGSKFITYDIDEDTIDKLKTYIDVKGINKFPKENVNRRCEPKAICRSKPRRDESCERAIMQRDIWMAERRRR